MQQSFIKLENVYLDYILKTGSSSIRKYGIQAIRKIFNQPLDLNSFHSTYRALDNINLEITQGEKVGIFGCNGAGKSTLLRVLAEIYKPNLGTVTTSGTMSCLFSIGLGLNPEASGIENVITMGVLRGLTREQAASMAHDVAEFTELGEFFTKPVRMYSSGMAMKLAFGVATAGNPDILLIDEVIGVGDGQFMQKARARLETLMHNSNILVLTSHDNNLVKKFCTKALVLNQGKMVFYGDVDSAIDYYNQILFPKAKVNNVEELAKEI
ncbi:MAG: ABC transporter ATP-binding protein [Gammaproteobacteria bacterium]|nr:ABC transporter ATP-binding protein [Gammaproteobacteria bacterium]